jgi:hypothetical protein
MPARFKRSITVVLAIWALVSIAPDFIRPFAPLGSLGLRADFGGRIVSVDKGGPAEAAGIIAATNTAPGDRIDFVRTPDDTLFAIFGGLGGLPLFAPGTRFEFVLISPAGTFREVSIEAAERDPPILERARLFVAEMLGIGFILLGAILAWSFPERLDVFGFFLFAIWFNPGENYEFYALLPRALRVPQEVLSALLQATGLAGFLVFALRFPTDRAEGWRRYVERCLPVFVIALTALALAGTGAEFGRPNRPLWLATFGLKAAVYPLVVAGFLSKLNILSAVDRQRLRLVLLGCIPGLFFYLIAESIDATSMWDPLFEQWHWQPPRGLIDVGYLANTLVPISIAYAVVRERVLPINAIVDRGVALGIVWVFVAMIAESCIALTHAFLEENHVVSTLIVAFMFVALAPLIEWLKDVVNGAVDRFFFLRLHRARAALAASDRDLAQTLSLAEIERLAVERPCDTMQLAAAALFVLDDRDGSYRLSAHRNWPATALTVIPAGDELLRKRVFAVRDPGFRETVSSRADVPHGPAAPNLVVALAPNAVIDALAVYSGHADGSAISADQIAVIVSFARSCGAVRAHVLAVAMRQEIARLRRAMGAADVRPLTPGANFDAAP